MLLSNAGSIVSGITPDIQIPDLFQRLLLCANAFPVDFDIIGKLGYISGF